MSNILSEDIWKAHIVTPSGAVLSLLLIDLILLDLPVSTVSNITNTD